MKLVDDSDYESSASDDKSDSSIFSASETSAYDEASDISVSSVSVVSETSASDESQSIDVMDAGGDVFEVERIVAKKKVRGKNYYKVRWLGYEPRDDTWEPEENFAQSLIAIEKFEEAEKNKLKTKANDNKAPFGFGKKRKNQRENEPPVKKAAVKEEKVKDSHLAPSPDNDTEMHFAQCLIAIEKFKDADRNKLKANVKFDISSFGLGKKRMNQRENELSVKKAAVKEENSKYGHLTPIFV